MSDQAAEQTKEVGFPFRAKVFILVMGVLAFTSVALLLGYSRKEETPLSTPPPIAVETDNAPADSSPAPTSGPVADSDSRQGEAIDYMDYYVKSQTGGVPVGKRYNFTAIVSSDLTIKNPDANITGVPHFLQGADAFDSDDARERFLRISDTKPKWVIVEMSPDGITLVHDIY